MSKNLNPLYEAHFLSGGDKKAGIKMLWNGIKKNGALETVKRNSEASLKRGIHVSNSHKSLLAMGGIDNDTEKMLKDIGKRATKGKKLSSKQAKALKTGNSYDPYD